VTQREADQHAWLNRMRSLWNIDGHLLADALTPEEQQEFTRDPPRYFMHANGVQAEAIWREIEKRQQR
jgi:hypothetical protein